LRLGDGIPFSQRFKKLFTLVKDTDAVEAAEPDHSIPPRGDREQGSASPMVVDARRAELSGSAPPASPAGVHAPEQAKTEESRPLPEPRPQVTPDGSGKDETEASGSPDSGVPVPPGPLPPASEPAAARAAAGAGPRIRLESGPSPQTGFEPEAADRPISGATPDPRPLDDPAAGEPQASPQTVHVQPVPGQAACAVPVEQGIVQERAWLRRSVGDRYDAAAGFVSRVMSESPGLGGGDKATAKDVLVDLSAVRLYLSGETRPFDAAVRGATVGPHVPLARCVAAGLRRLPSYRGAAMLRAALGEAERGWYHQGRVVTEWAFCAALAGADPGLPGNTDILIWSLTARRTALLEPKVPDRVLFLPGTRFKVLHVRTGDRYVVLLRELSLTEMADDGRAGVETLPLDEIALAGLERADTAWQEADRPAALPPEYTDTFDAPPGLIIAGRPPVAAETNGAVPTRKVVRR
jgi:hypothetical protein